MPRLTWLADELRKAGVKVVEVPGWQTRGNESFTPRGVTWHATAGSRLGSAQDEVHVLLNGSTTAPPPIAQLMIYRDGTVYLCAAGRCNHNKVGWAGPNKGYGNTYLLGIEMANDNRGEPWPDVQLDAARRATAAIMRRLGADPMKSLAGHYEHQPAAGRPAGETSVKSDPYGVRMADERTRVAAMMRETGVSQADVIAALKSPEGQNLLFQATMGAAFPIAGSGAKRNAATVLGWIDTNFNNLAAIVKAADLDEAKLADLLAARVLAGLPKGSDPVTHDELVGALRQVFSSVGTA